MTKLPFLIAACCLASAAEAHDVRHGNGSLWAHDHLSPYFTGGQVRNVSVTGPQVIDCERATWPDIPATCVARERPKASAKGDRVVVALSADTLN